MPPPKEGSQGGRTGLPDGVGRATLTRPAVPSGGREAQVQEGR